MRPLVATGALHFLLRCPDHESRSAQSPFGGFRRHRGPARAPAPGCRESGGRGGGSGGGRGSSGSGGGSGGGEVLVYLRLELELRGYVLPEDFLHVELLSHALSAEVADVAHLWKKQLRKRFAKRGVGGHEHVRKRGTFGSGKPSTLATNSGAECQSREPACGAPCTKPCRGCICNTRRSHHRQGVNATQRLPHVYDRPSSFKKTCQRKTAHHLAIDLHRRCSGKLSPRPHPSPAAAAARAAFVPRLVVVPLMPMLRRQFSPPLFLQKVRELGLKAEVEELQELFLSPCRRGRGGRAWGHSAALARKCLSLVFRG